MDLRQTWLDGIDAFLFDLGNVLLRFSHETMMAQMAAVTGLPLAQVRRLLIDERLLNALESGDLDETAFVLEFQRRSATFHVPDFLQAMADIFAPIHETVGLLPHLKAAGKRLVLVSNTSSIHFGWEERRSPWLAHFHAKVLSYDIRSMKPDPAFYRAALARAETAPGRCLFIDDIEDNIDGARRAGFQIHHFTGPEGFLKKFPWHKEASR